VEKRIEVKTVLNGTIRKSFMLKISDKWKVLHDALITSNALDGGGLKMNFGSTTGQSLSTSGSPSDDTKVYVNGCVVHVTSDSKASAAAPSSISNPR